MLKMNKILPNYPLDDDSKGKSDISSKGDQFLDKAGSPKIGKPIDQSMGLGHKLELVRFSILTIFFSLIFLKMKYFINKKKTHRFDPIQLVKAIRVHKKKIGN